METAANRAKGKECEARHPYPLQGECEKFSHRPSLEGVCRSGRSGCDLSSKLMLSTGCFSSVFVRELGQYNSLAHFNCICLEPLHELPGASLHNEVILDTTTIT